MRTLRLLCLTSILALAVSELLAQGVRVPSCACGTPSRIPTPWDIRHSDPDAQFAALQSFAAWVVYVDVLNPTVGSPVDFDLGNGRNEILFFDFSSVPDLDPSTVGFAPSLPQEAFGSFNECPRPPGEQCGTIVEADVLISNKIPWHFNRPNVDDPRDAGYYHSTARHEIGHTMGFHHSFKNVSTLNYYQDFAGLYVTRADVLAARAHFPGRVTSILDLATYPFTYNADIQNGADGTGAVRPANFGPTTVRPGGSIFLNNWTIENLGNSPVNEVRIFFYLSANTNITTSDIPLGGFIWNPLSTWDEELAGTTFTVPANVPPGTYYVGAIVGFGSNFQQDGIGYNNSWYLPSPVVVAPTGTGTRSRRRAVRR